MNLHQHAKIQSHFPNFWGKKFFPENLALSCTTSYGFLAPGQNLEKNLMIQFQENDWTDRSTERRMEGCTDPILWDPSGYRRGYKKEP